MFRQMPATSLRLLLSVVMVGLLAVVSATLLTITYSRAREVALENVDRNMRTFADRMAGRLEVLSGDTAALVGMVASVANSLLAEPVERMDDKVSVLRQMIAHSRHLESVYVGYPDGAFFQVVDLGSTAWRAALNAPRDAAIAVRLIVPTSGVRAVHVIFFGRDGKRLSGETATTSTFDPRMRAWYMMAVKTDGPIATGPYVMATTSVLGMTISQSHSGNRKIVIGADVILKTLTDFLRQERITPGSLAFLVDERGKPIIHSDPAMNDRIMTSKTERDFDPAMLFDPLMSRLKTDPPVPGKTSLVNVRGRTFVVMATSVKSAMMFTGDTLVTAAPLDELLVSANRGFAQGLLISGAIVAIAILFALLLAHLITKSLHQLTQSADRFQDLDFKTPIEIPSRVIEITSLGKAMNRARDAIFTFTLYVPREFVRRGMESGHFSSRSARRQEVTALFTDIYDFTTISERHSPEEVVAMLSEYFDILNSTVEAHGGTIIQFLGDSVFAMWNAPVGDPRHAEHACAAAIEMNRRLADFNSAQRLRGLPEFHTRCGIHTGVAVVGSVGASDRLQYTAMGDTINVASRLEGINKTYRTSILASAAVVAQCEDKTVFRVLGNTQAKGRVSTIEIYEVVDCQAQ